MAFDNILNKFKASTKQAADQMGKAAKIAKFKMDLMTLSGEKTRHLQSIGQKTVSLHKELSGIDGNELLARVNNEFEQIERIEQRVREIENEIAELQALIQHANVSDVEVTEVKSETSSGEKGQ